MMIFKFYIWGKPASGKTTLTRFFGKNTYILNAFSLDLSSFQYQVKDILAAARNHIIENPVIIVNEYHMAPDNLKKYVETELVFAENGFGLVLMSQKKPTARIKKTGFSICHVERAPECSLEKTKLYLDRSYEIEAPA